MEVEKLPALTLVRYHVTREQEEICDALGRGGNQFAEERTTVGSITFFLMPVA